MSVFMKVFLVNFSKEHDKMLSFILCQSTHEYLSVDSQLFVNVRQLTSK